MKKAIVGLLLLVGMTSIAQRSGDDNRHNLKGLTPEQIAILRTKKMTLALDLSQLQQKQIQNITLESVKFHKMKMIEHRSNKENKVVQKPSSEEIFLRQNERLDFQIAQKSKIKAILSKEQFAKWEKANLYKRTQRSEKGKERCKKSKAMHKTK